MEPVQIPVTSQESTECVIHSPVESPTAPLVELRATLLQAAQIREYQPLLDIAHSLNPNEIPKIKYHARCRKIFTMKKSLETIKQKSNGDEVTPNVTRRSIRQPGSGSTVYEQICIVCGKSTEIYQRLKNTGTFTKMCHDGSGQGIT